MSFYLYRNGKHEGPYPDDQVREAVLGGAIQPDELVCEKGSSEWRAAKDVFPPAGPAVSPAPVPPATVAPPQVANTSPIQDSPRESWYFCRNDGQVRGPLNGSTLARLYDANYIRPEDQIVVDGESNWTPASEHSDLKRLCHVAPPPEDRQFFFAHDGRSIGPFTQKEMGELVHGRALGRRDQITNDWGGNWHNVGAALAVGLVARQWATANEDISGYYDLNGDGYAETFAIDQNGDGSIDGIALDTNHDGVADVMGVDTNFDGELDAVAADTNFDGQSDLVGVDSDFNGQVDIVQADLNYDGAPDLVGADFDGDGVADFASMSPPELPSALIEMPEIGVDSGMEGLADIEVDAESGEGFLDLLGGLFG